MESFDWYDVKRTAEKSYREIRLAKAEGKVLAARGLTLDDFQKNGKQLIPPETYGRIDAQLSLYDLEADLLIAGFSEDQIPAIMTVANPGVATDHSKIGFWCIGSGSTLAKAAMFARDYSWRMSLERAAYTVYEAKRTAERASGVGDKETDVTVLMPAKAGRIEPGRLAPKTIAALAEVYDDLKPREFSPDHLHRLQEMDDFKDLRNS
jgi:hypothetical protein